MDQITLTHLVFGDPVFYTLQTLIVQTFHWSVKTGKVLVNIMKFLLENTIRVVEGGVNLTFAIVDSLEQFSLDCVQILGQLWDFMEILGSCCLRLFFALVYVFEEIVSLLLALDSGINQQVTLLWNLLINTIIKLKSLLVLFGSGVWFALTFIPSLVVYLTLNVFHYICNFKEITSNFLVTSARNVRTYLYKVYQFVTDVPLESLLGIMLASCLIYIFVKFFWVLFYYFYRKTQHFYRKIIRLKSQLSKSRNRPATIRPPRSKPRMSSDERYCIICTECMKCIVLLPCRHLCLCTECSEKVRRSNNNSCPICRCYIEDRIKVFM